MDTSILAEMIAEREQKIERINAEIFALIARPDTDIAARERLFSTIRQKEQQRWRLSIELDALREAAGRLKAAKGVSVPALAVVA